MGAPGTSGFASQRCAVASPVMTRSFSVYLDLVRFLAAFLVLLHHARYLYNPGHFLFSLGHEAVIVFFLLSGYVIAYVSDTKERTLRDYSISRLARIYSVVVPAILLTGSFDFIGYSVDPDAYPAGYQAWDLIPIRVIASLLFLNQVWFLSIQPFSNVPYWSLGYEVWYYAGFALVTYVGGRKGWLLFLMLALLLGPKIIILMPLWWAGVYLYRSQTLRRISPGLGWVLVLASILGLAAYVNWNVAGWGRGLLLALVGPEWTREFVSSQRFPADYVLALCVATHFVGLRAICERYQEVSALWARPIQALAGSTFTLYLLHRPMILFYFALFGAGGVGATRVSPDAYVGYILLIVATAYGVSLVTEQKKHIVKRWITALFDWVGQFMAGVFGTHRGLVRLVIANILWMFGPYRRYGRVDFTKVRRLVFVCQGNVCRSPFGHHLAQKLMSDLPVASLGLGAGSGHPADHVASVVARDFGVDLSRHKTTALADFVIQKGDLFLVMEDRHLRALAPHLQGHEVQLALLGLWCRPPLALLYDPYRLSRSYFTTCFGRIEQAVEALRDAMGAPGARKL